MIGLQRYQSGLGMIEVLVAVVILSVGLLGMAALQVTSTKMTAQSQYKTQAILLAQDIVERIRANSDNANNYGVNMDGSERCESDFAPGGGSVASKDRAEWVNSVRCLLPDGQGSVAINGAQQNINVILRWETRTDANDDSFIQGQNTLALTARF